MPRRSPVRLAAALLVVLAWAQPACNRVQVGSVPPAPSGPNVLLVTIDTLRADHVGLYGDRPSATPTLDALGLQGVVFETAISTAPLTLPAHASILSGLTPPRHGVRHNGVFVLEPGIARLPQRFQEAGYDTAAFVGSVVLAREYGLDAGFDLYDAAVSSQRAAANGYQERTAREVTDAALEWLRGRRRPFFAWVHYYDPHAAYRPPPPFDRRFEHDPYRGEIAFVDAQLARLLEALRGPGELERTLVVVTADHGESLGEHGEKSHGYSLYDATQRVPMLLQGPGVPAGRRVATPVSLVDLAPTLLALARLPMLKDVDGRDLVFLLRGEEGVAAADGVPLYAETLATRIDHGWAPLHALRSRRYLYIRAPRPELYEVTRDPGQLENLLAQANPDEHAVQRELEAALSELLARERKSAPLEIDAVRRAQLRALGYAIPASPVPATELDPKDGLRLLPMFEYAKLQYTSGRVEEAQRVATQLLPDMPESPELNTLLALVYLSLNRPDRAIDHLRSCLQRTPDSARHLVLLGLAQVHRAEWAMAVATFEKAAEIDPTSAEAQVGLMWRFRLGGTVEEAALAAERAVSLEPENAEIRLLVADAWDQLGQRDRALGRYREALEMDPANGLAHLGVAVNLVRLGDAATAERHVVAAGPVAQGISARMRLAIAFAGAGQTQRAEEILRGLVRERPDFEGARRVLAGLLEHTGRSEEAAAVRAQGVAR